MRATNKRFKGVRAKTAIPPKRPKSQVLIFLRVQRYQHTKHLSVHPTLWRVNLPRTRSSVQRCSLAAGGVRLFTGGVDLFGTRNFWGKRKAVSHPS